MFNIIIKNVLGYEAYLVTHGDGPLYKGGIRFEESVSIDELKDLAFKMSQKCEYYHLPFTGAKAGVKVNPATLSVSQREKIARSFAQEFKDYLGTWIGAPDMGSGELEMDAIAYELHDLSVVTGKSVKFGGLEGRKEATGWGGYCILKQLKDVETIAVQGFGNVGEYFIQFATADNYVLLGATDKDGAVIGELDNHDLLAMEVDCLVLAACENQITSSNVQDVKAKYVLELANGGISPEVKPLLIKKGIKIIDDYKSNSGGVIASYLEYKQNTTNCIYSKEKVYEIIKNKMKGVV